MKNFLRIAEGIDIMPLLIEIQRQPQLWNQQTYRKNTEVHSEISDIWIRYAEKEDYQKPHIPGWYPAYYALPSVKPILFGLMSRTEGEMLGGVLITRIPAGGQIKPHIDKGWHPEFYDKFYLSLKSQSGANFHCEDEMICPTPGDIYWFDNTKEHWIDNQSPDDRMTLIVCIRTHRFKELHASSTK